MQIEMVSAELGHLVSEHGKSRLLPILLAIVFIIPIYLTYESGIRMRDMAMASAGTAMLIPCVLAYLDRLKYYVLVYEKGIVEHSMFGAKTIRFDGSAKIKHKSVKESLEGIHVATQINIMVSNQNQKIILRNSIRDVAGLRDELMDIELSAIAPLAMSAYLSGKTVDFSRLKLLNGYLVYKNKSLAVSRISSFSLEGGLFRVWQTGQKSTFLKVPAYDIANLLTLLAILQETTSLRPETTYH